MREYPAAWPTKSFSLSRSRDGIGGCIPRCVFSYSHRIHHTYTRLSYYLIASSHPCWACRLVLVPLHIGLRAQWIPRPSSASFSPLAANLCAPANHHRIARRLHHRILLARETLGSSRAREAEVALFTHRTPHPHPPPTLSPPPPPSTPTTLSTHPLRPAQKSCSAIDLQSWRQSQRH